METLVKHCFKSSTMNSEQKRQYLNNAKQAIKSLKKERKRLKDLISSGCETSQITDNESAFKWLTHLISKEDEDCSISEEIPVFVKHFIPLKFKDNENEIKVFSHYISLCILSDDECGRIEGTEHPECRMFTRFMTNTMLESYEIKFNGLEISKRYQNIQSKELVTNEKLISLIDSLVNMYEDGMFIKLKVIRYYSPVYEQLKEYRWHNELHKNNSVIKLFHLPVIFETNEIYFKSDDSSDELAKRMLTRPDEVMDIDGFKLSKDVIETIVREFADDSPVRRTAILSFPTLLRSGKKINLFFRTYYFGKVRIKNAEYTFVVSLNRKKELTSMKLLKKIYKLSPKFDEESWLKTFEIEVETLSGTKVIIDKNYIQSVVLGHDNDGEKVLYSRGVIYTLGNGTVYQKEDKIKNHNVYYSVVKLDGSNKVYLILIKAKKLDDGTELVKTVIIKNLAVKGSYVSFF